MDLRAATTLRRVTIADESYTFASVVINAVGGSLAIEDCTVRRTQLPAISRRKTRGGSFSAIDLRSMPLFQPPPAHCSPPPSVLYAFFSLLVVAQFSNINIGVGNVVIADTVILDVSNTRFIDITGHVSQGVGLGFGHVTVGQFCG